MQDFTSRLHEDPDNRIREKFADSHPDQSEDDRSDRRMIQHLPDAAFFGSTKVHGKDRLGILADRIRGALDQRAEADDDSIN